MPTSYPDLTEPRHADPDCVGLWRIGVLEIQCTRCGHRFWRTPESRAAAQHENELTAAMLDAAGNGAMLIRGELRPSAVGV